MEQPAIDKKKLVELSKKNDFSYLGLFGSFARGEATRRSDIDLLVHFSKRKSLLEVVRMEREFTESLGRPVELLTESSISPFLIDRIKAEVQVIYEKKG